jgi:hypothetical protein
MPYLSLGEFYGEFGRYDVSIDLPSSYNIAATGLKQSSKNSSSSRVKHQFYAEQVHEFSWIAGKDFIEEEKRIELESGKTINVRVWYTEKQQDLWKNAMRYTEDAVRFYSKNVGEYPYEEVSVIQHPLKVGGGQEYPMITFIDDVKDARELDHVIAHEIGHNWFYGILANNERKYAWMDEGLDVYYDTRYTYEKYGDDHLSSYLPGFARDKELSLIHYGYHTQALRHDDQAPNTSAEKLKPINYPLSAYIKPSLAFLYLEKYVGTDAFDNAMTKYYDQWKFKHPGPDDLKEVLSNELGIDLSWLFAGFLDSNKQMDYAIKKVSNDNGQTKFVIENKGEINAPIKWSAYYKNQLISSAWIEGFDETKEVLLPGNDYDWITLDAETFSLDADRTNNHIKPKALFKKYRPTKYGWIGGFDDSRFDKRYLLPLLAFNKYDGLMLGFADYEPLFPGKPVEQEFIPLFGLGSKNFTGIYNLRSKHYFNKGLLNSLEWGLHAKSFSYAEVNDSDDEFRYWTVKPHLKFNFSKRPLSKNDHSIEYKLHYTKTDDEKISEDLSSSFYIHDLNYHFTKKHVLTPIRAKIGIEHQSYKVFNSSETKENYTKLYSDLNMGYQFSKTQKLSVRVFVATYLKNTKRESNNYSAPFVRGSTPLSYQGFNDYVFDEYFFGRSQQEGIWAQQVSIRDGGFKTVTGSSFASFGQTNNFLASINLISDFPVQLPCRFPLKLYFDAGVFSAKSNASDPLENNVWYSGGLMFDFFDGFFSIYIPLINASEINDLYNSIDAGFARKISFSLDLKKIHPDRLKENQLF